MTKMTATNKISEVVEALSHYEFRYESTSDGFLEFQGVLRHEECAYDCEMYIAKDFASLPLIRLKAIPGILGAVAPHLSAMGWLCYLSRSSTVINIFDPVGQTIAFVKRAEYVLGQILDGSVVDDLADEFFAYWGSSSNSCFFDVDDFESKSLHLLWGFEKSESNQAFLSNDLVRTKMKAAALGRNIFQNRIPVLAFVSPIPPQASLVHWPISNLGEFLSWQRHLDGPTSYRIEAAIKNTVRCGAPGVVVAIKSPRFIYSLVILFTKSGKLKEKKVSLDELRESIAMPYFGSRIDDKFIVERNVPSMKTLAEKRIALVGCGTIGGYLADLLVRAGAGSGGGELVLIDNDILTTGNLGRHILGFSDVGKNKARGMARKFLRDTPGANVKSIQLDAKEVNLTKMDLVIDATGEESLGYILEPKYRAAQARLSAWIEGPGIAVRGHLKTERGQACGYCLANYAQEGQYHATVEPMPKIYAGQGCEQEYVPFPATVSIQAACLALDMALDWAAGNQTSTLRTRVVVPGYTCQPDSSPPSIEGCPACDS
ncbi:thiamine biosynthesis protein ThiF [Janthinobacterium svalbardensis]|uniref:Thiamine biosynthesis protein ThiF n=1 Tax=Janthinobacterium svalbardensis TaxID=368607 RepID=A0A290WYH4_9BURK|nr:ThiF family adenylyltransferase [Janthinobacterium svalbardensis]ATD61959.1 thiamine biosynthesis protein ThiF [Janthinobacterium svalbardensis]